MSTSWYGFIKPVTSIAVKSRGDERSFDVILWVNRQQAGQIIVTQDELPDFLDLVINRNQVIVHQYYGGKKQGMVTAWVGPEDFHGQVVSEYYEELFIHRGDYNMNEARHLWKPFGSRLPDRPSGE
jgi:hypothetical protein